MRQAHLVHPPSLGVSLPRLWLEHEYTARAEDGVHACKEGFEGGVAAC
jgi:hypothetical protein